MFENKSKIMVAAIAAAFALPLAAQAQSSVTVYGKMYPAIDNVNLSGATAKGTAVSTLSAAAATTADSTRTTMDAPNSRLGFRGTEDLGGNLKAIFQLEMGFNIDTGAASSTTQLFSRDTFVGLAGDFGTVRLGSVDTVYKTLGDTMSFLGITSGNYMSTSNILSKGGFGTSSASSFHLRRTNSLMYDSPTIAGFTALFDLSLGEIAGNFSAQNVISTGIKYEAGPLYAAIAYERHNDLFGASLNIPVALANNTNLAAHSKDTAVRGTVQYKFPASIRAEVNVARLKYDETGGAVGKFDDYAHNTWSIAAEKVLGAVTLVASYGQSGAGGCSLVGGIACNTSGLEAKMLNIGASYSFSKRTSVFAVASEMRNGVSAVQSNLINGSSLTPGQDIRTIGVGLSHSF